MRNGVERLAKRDCDQTGFQPVTWNRNANGLFACKWLRAPATMDDEGLADAGERPVHQGRPTPGARTGGLRGRVPAPPHSRPAAPRPDRSGARRTPSCLRREAAFVVIRPVRPPIDGGGVSGLACGSTGPARSTR
jgi:hypothetical protein